MLRAMSAALIAAGFLAVSADADEPKILARGPWPFLPTHAAAGALAQRQLAIRSREELARAAGEGALVTVPKALKVEAIAFANQMILAVEDGTQPMVGVSGGGPPSAPLALAITAIERDDAAKVMTVRWQRYPRLERHGIITRPLAAVLVQRFDGGVKFVKLPDAKAGEAEPKTAEKVLASAFWPDGWRPETPRQEWVIRDYADLIDRRLAAPENVLERMRQQAAARYAKALKVEGIDFTTQMIVGVSGGVQPAGARVEITRIERDPASGVLTVRWKLHSATAGHSEGGVSHPAEVVLVDRVAGEVKFRRDGR